MSLIAEEEIMKRLVTALGTLGLVFGLALAVQANPLGDLVELAGGIGQMADQALDISAVVAPVPLPGTLVLVGVGLLGILGLRRRQ
jgi:hypothetical protein